MLSERSIMQTIPMVDGQTQTDGILEDLEKVNMKLKDELIRKEVQARSIENDLEIKEYSLRMIGKVKKESRKARSSRIQYNKAITEAIVGEVRVLKQRLKKVEEQDNRRAEMKETFIQKTGSNPHIPGRRSENEDLEAKKK
ncbi:hypothetical protein HHI36_004161 [Cryptolaemus montrouzieri]|uniref:Uncharacterized protein n=1 Tax=Cryptolaemus montrouzieri TaxID=559131 RepID=A0ABD2NQN9_9CUCU